MAETATYKNPWHNRLKPEYGPAFFTTTARPQFYKGHAIYRQIEKGLDPINALVGGYFTQVPLRDPAVILYANEDGLRLALPQSAVQVIPDTGEWVEILVGTLVAFGPAKAGEETDATEATIAALNRHLIPVVRTEKVVRFE